LAGSYLVESWTDEIERRATAYIETIDAMGGALKAIEKGYVQREIQESAYRWQLAVDSCDKIVVGVNRYRVEEEPVLNLLRVNPDVGARQAARLHALRERRDNEMMSSVLSKLRAGTQNDDNLVPLILGAVESYATLGEICAVLREAFGEYQAHTLF